MANSTQMLLPARYYKISIEMIETPVPSDDNRSSYPKSTELYQQRVASIDIPNLIVIINGMIIEEQKNIKAMRDMMDGPL